MTFSDGTTTIRHAVNSCINHKDREGRNLCVHCGNWFCDECMSVTHRYLCAECAVSAMEAAENMKMAKKNQALSRERVFLPLLFAGFMIATLILKKAGIVLVALPLVLLFTVMKLFPRQRNVWHSAHDNKYTRQDMKNNFFSKDKKEKKEITKEQFLTALRLNGGCITVSKLARQTDVSEKTAKAFLDKEVVEGRLNVEASELELIYKN